MKVRTKNIMLIILMLSMETVLGQSYSVISSGGGKALGSNNIIIFTAGESVVGKTTGTANIMAMGFWSVYQQDVLTSVEGEEELPIEFRLEQNYPNPFNPSTVIKYAVPERSKVLIKIYNITGEEIETLVNEEKDRGWYEVKFNTAGLSSGIYIYRMQAGNYINTKKMMLVK